CGSRFTGPHFDGGGYQHFVMDTTALTARPSAHPAYSREELLKMSVPDIEVGLSQMERDDNYDNMELNGVTTLHGIHRRKNGTTLPISIRSSVFESGGRRYALALVRDETERIEAEQKLIENEKKTRAFLNAFIGSAGLMDPNGILIDANDPMLDRFGKTLDEAIGTPIGTLADAPAEIRRERKRKREQVVESKQPVQFETCVDDIWYQHSLYPILDEDGKYLRSRYSTPR
ncbi:MAG: hypothetical protein CMM10_04380, partial [Rhodospirillaceae bacterium]|nr:hypothetical protein [Rhodospirillaceae bacterium]